MSVSEATVRRRVKRLRSHGVIDIVACVDLAKIGLEAEALVFLQTDLDKLTQIGRQLAEMVEVREVTYTSGIYDLVVRLVLPSSDDLLPFLTRRIAPIPGIRSTQTAYVLRAEKRPQDWQLPEAAVVRETTSPGPLILLVDDDADFATAAKMVLEAEGYRVILAGDGHEALVCMRRDSPAIVLLDLMVAPPLAGLEVARSLRTDARQRGVPILALSAIRSTEWVGQLPAEANLPFDDFVEKPIEPGALLEKVHRLIG